MVNPNPEPYRDCDECGERYHGDAIPNYLGETEISGEVVTLCLRCLKIAQDAVGPEALKIVRLRKARKALWAWHPRNPTDTDLLRELYEKVKDMEDRSAGDGDGRIDTWQSSEFESLLARVKEALDG